MTAVDDLPEPTRSSPLQGYLAHWSRMLTLAEDYPELANATVHDERAYADGQEVRGALGDPGLPWFACRTDHDHEAVHP